MAAGLNSQLNLVHADALEYLRGNIVKYDLVFMSDLLMFIPKTSGTEIIRLAYGALSAKGYLWITTMLRLKSDVFLSPNGD